MIGNSQNIVNCPSCSTETLSKICGENKGYNCSQCDGVWLTGADLVKISLHHSLELGVLTARFMQDKRCDSQRICPNCDTALRVSTVCEVQLDWCAICDGIWFDHDEFSRVVSNATKNTTTEKVLITGSIVDILSVVIRGLT